MKKLTYRVSKLILILLFCLSTTACIGTMVGVVVDTTIEVVKIPFKVGAAVIDVATDDDFTDLATNSTQVDSDLNTDAAAVKMENSEIQ